MLNREWNRIVHSLQNITSIYDKANRVISLGFDVKLRIDGISMALNNQMLVLDAGCGLGKMSELILQEKRARELVLLDPLPSMILKAHKKLRKNSVHSVLGLFEYMPFRSRSFDAIACGFSLRDALDFKSAVRELSRVLKRSGRLLIVEMGKPDDVALRWIIGLYWMIFVPLIMRILFGERGKFYSALYTSYTRYPMCSEVEKLLLGCFKKLFIERRMLGGALIMIAFNPRSQMFGL